MFCPQCGANNQDSAHFCSNCGRQLSEVTPPAAGPPAVDWRDYDPSLPPPPSFAPVPPPVPTPAYQPAMEPPPFLIGIPREQSSGGAWMLATACVVLIAALAFAAIRFGGVDTDSWPLVGKGDGSSSTEVSASKPSAILVSLTTACKDSKGQACNQVWDITGVRATASETSIDYEVKATGKGGCSVDLSSDQAATLQQEALGKPGVFLEGGRGRYYPLLSSTGFAANGGTLACNKTQKGTWTFATVTGETTVKLRHPNVAPARIDLTPLALTALPPNDPLAFIPVPAGACTSTQGQQCRGAWQIGPYGVASDKSIVLFFTVRYEGPPGCMINWQPDIGTHQALLRSGQKGLHLEVPGQPDLTMVAGGGVAAANQGQPCGQTLSGFWRFAAGNLAPTISFYYPDFSAVQLPIRPQRLP